MSAIPEKSIAVLPFENRSEDKTNAYFADGVQDEILTRLSKIADLKVISRTSTQHYKSAPENLPVIAKQLGVAHIVEGSVQKSGDAVRVNVQLIKAANDSHLWAESFDRKLTDIFSVESEVAKAIADQLRAKLTGQEAASHRRQIDRQSPGLRCLSARTGVYAENDFWPRRISQRAEISERGGAPRSEVRIGLGVAVEREFARLHRGVPATNRRPYAKKHARPRKPHSHCSPISAKLWSRRRFITMPASKITTRPSVILSKRDRSSRTAALHLSSLPMSRAGVVNGIEANFTLNRRNGSTRAIPICSRKVCFRTSTVVVSKKRKDSSIRYSTSHRMTSTRSLRKQPSRRQKAICPVRRNLLAPLHPTPSSTFALEKLAYQAILERNPAPVISQLRAILIKPDPALGYANGELRFWLGWAEDIGGDHAAAQESWRQARGELEPLLKEQPQNHFLIGDLALITMSLGDKAAASAFAERDVAVNPVERRCDRRSAVARNSSARCRSSRRT